MPETKLISLEDHNEISRKHQFSANGNVAALNGIACPECGCELYDTHPGMTLLSFPSQLDVHCSNKECKYKGYRVR